MALFDGFYKAISKSKVQKCTFILLGFFCLFVLLFTAFLLHLYFSSEVGCSEKATEIFGDNTFLNLCFAVICGVPQATVNTDDSQDKVGDEPQAAKRPRLPNPPTTAAMESLDAPVLLQECPGVTPYSGFSVNPGTSAAPCLSTQSATISTPVPTPSADESYTHSSSYIAYMESLLNSDFPSEDVEQAQGSMY